jgi:hypothetical protein
VQKVCLFAPAAAGKISLGRGRLRSYLCCQCSAASLRLPLYLCCQRSAASLRLPLHPLHESGSSTFLRNVRKSLPVYQSTTAWSVVTHGTSSLIAFLTIYVPFDVTLSYCCMVGRSKVLIWFTVRDIVCLTVQCHGIGALDRSVNS